MVRAAAAPACAGVLSSYGELEHMASGRAELAAFDPTQKQPKMSYKVSMLGHLYWVLAASQDPCSATCMYCSCLRLWRWLQIVMHVCVKSMHMRLVWTTVWPAQDGYQKKYFVLESFEDGARKLREYCATITPPELMDKFMNSAVPFPRGARSAAVGAGRAA